VAAADLRDPEGRDRGRKAGHGLDGAEEAGLALEGLPPGVHVAIVRHSHGVHGARGDNLDLLAPQSWHREELWRILRTAVPQAAVGSGTAAVDHTLVGQHQEVIAADGDLPYPALDSVKLGAGHRLGGVAPVAEDLALPRLLGFHRRLAGDVRTVQASSEHPDVPIEKAWLRLQFATRLAIQQEHLSAGNHPAVPCGPPP